MSIDLHPRRYNATLPPTPVEPEMRLAFVKIAESEQVSLAQIQRIAFTLFLTQYQGPVRQNWTNNHTDEADQAQSK